MSFSAFPQRVYSLLISCMLDYGLWCMLDYRLFCMLDYVFAGGFVISYRDIQNLWYCDLRKKFENCSITVTTQCCTYHNSCSTGECRNVCQVSLKSKHQTLTFSFCYVFIVITVLIFMEESYCVVSLKIFTWVSTSYIPWYYGSCHSCVFSCTSMSATLCSILLIIRTNFSFSVCTFRVLSERRRLSGGRGRGLNKILEYG